MTAEVAIMNREAVALAADSAATASVGGDNKVFVTANKIFPLSKLHPVGVMIYGNTGFMESPWETIIKVYRKQLGRRSFPELPQYLDDFVEFLEKQEWLNLTELQASHVTRLVTQYYESVRLQLRGKLESAFSSERALTGDDAARLLAEIVEERHSTWKQQPFLPCFDREKVKDIRRTYGPAMRRARSTVFGELPIGRTTSRQLQSIGTYVCTKWPDWHGTNLMSGVIVAGFGDDDIFPKLSSVKIEGIIADQIRIKDPVVHNVIKDGPGILAFAQQEMVHTFMTGVDPRYEYAIETAITRLVHEYPNLILGCMPGISDDDKVAMEISVAGISADILKQALSTLEQYRQQNFVYPVLAVVNSLPKDELAGMAESLVNLTSLKRKMSPGQETVAGPIDVAVISKGDGLIWVKRKHYFKPELNQHFFANYFRELQKAKEAVENGEHKTSGVSNSTST